MSTSAGMTSDGPGTRHVVEGEAHGAEAVAGVSRMAAERPADAVDREADRRQGRQRGTMAGCRPGPRRGSEDRGAGRLTAWKRRRRVVVVGPAAGLELVKGLAAAPVDVVLVDANNFNTFQPLLYQVATAGLDGDDIARPVRAVALPGQRRRPSGTGGRRRRR